MRRQERADRRTRRRTRHRERNRRIAAAVCEQDQRSAAAIAAAAERSAAEARTRQLRDQALADAVQAVPRARTVDVNLAIAARRARQAALLQQRAVLTARLRHHGIE